MQFFRVFGPISALISFFVCLCNYDSFHSCYGAMLLLPLLFLLFSLLFSAQYRAQVKKSLVVYASTAIQWARAVLLPFASALSTNYQYLPWGISEEAAGGAMALLIYEHIVIYIILLFLQNKDNKQKVLIDPVKVEEPNTLAGNRLAYLMFFVFAMGIFFVFLRNEKIFSFIFLEAEQEIVEEEGSGGSIFTYIFLVAVLFLIFTIVDYCSEKYKATKNKKWYFWALLICGIRVCLLTSSGRMAQVYIGLGLTVVLLAAFPSMAKNTLKIMLLLFAGVIISVSLFKTFHVSSYGSYEDALSGNTVDLPLIASQIDAYLSGPTMLTYNLEYIRKTDISHTTLVFDIFRNIFGVHYLFKSGQVGTVGGYNLWRYGGTKSGGYLFSGTAYSAAYLSPVLAPLSVAICLLIAYWFEHRSKKTHSIESKYLYTLGYSRLIFCGYLAFTGSLNIISRNFILMGLVIFVSSLFRSKSTKMKTKTTD